MKLIVLILKRPWIIVFIYCGSLRTVTIIVLAIATILILFFIYFALIL